MSLSAKEVQEIRQGVQSAQQDAQEAKQIAQDVSQSVQDAKQTVQGTTQEKSSVVDSVTQNKQEEIGYGEATRHQMFVDDQLWGVDKKHIAASEQSERVRSIDLDRELKEIEVKTAQIELARKEHNFAHSQKLDSLQIRSSEQAELFKHALNLEYAKFNSAVSEPIAPNTTDSGGSE